MTFVNKIYNKTQTGQLLLVSLEELIRELGTADPLHRVPYGAYEPCTTNSWIQLPSFGFGNVPFENTDVEILKKSGVYHVDKMRLIQLMRSDFQINNKMLGWRMLAQAEKYGTIEADQHGSRKHHQAILACLNKVLLADVMWQRKLAGAFCMNDAKSCYDRIVRPLCVCNGKEFRQRLVKCCWVPCSRQSTISKLDTEFLNPCTRVRWAMLHFRVRGKVTAQVLPCGL
jgi:hypothetical protein